jgi:hypothetical protein
MDFGKGKGVRPIVSDGLGSRARGNRRAGHLPTVQGDGRVRSSRRAVVVAIAPSQILPHVGESR